MLSVGIYEILVILLVACVLIKPQEVPSYITHAKKLYRYFMKLKWEIHDAINHHSYIKGDDGSLYKSYSNTMDDDINDDDTPNHNVKKINK